MKLLFKIIKGIIGLAVVGCVALLMIVNIPDIKDFWNDDIRPKIAQAVEDKQEVVEETPAESTEEVQVVVEA